MSVKLAKLLAVFVGNKDSTIGKIGKGAVIAIISLFVAITVLIGAIFSDGINFNQNIVTDLFEGNPITEFQGEQAQFINDVQHGLSLIDTKMNETNQTFTNGATLNAYQVKGYFIGLMFSKQKMNFDENKGTLWVKSFTIESNENEVKKIPQIEDAIVLPYSDTIRGNQIVLFVITIDKITKKDLLIKMKDNLMKNEIPKKIIFLNSFPYTSSEKIDRLALLKML